MYWKSQKKTVTAKEKLYDIMCALCLIFMFNSMF